jgi:hypothetical protein
MTTGHVSAIAPAVKSVRTQCDGTSVVLATTTRIAAPDAAVLDADDADEGADEDARGDVEDREAPRAEPAPPHRAVGHREEHLADEPQRQQARDGGLVVPELDAEDVERREGRPHEERHEEEPLVAGAPLFGERRALPRDERRL